MDTRALLDSLDVGVVAIAPDWKIVEWSAAAARIMGLPVGRALRRECWDTFPQAKGTETERVLRQVLADGRPRIARLPRGVPGIPGLAVTVQVTRGPGNHLTMVLQPAPEHRRPQVWAGELLNAVEAAGMRCDGRLLALNSYENRVYQVGLEEGGAVVAKFYRPARWSDAQILEEHGFATDLAQAEVPVVAPLAPAGETLLRAGEFRLAIFPRRAS